MGTVVFCEDDVVIQKLIRAALRASKHQIHVATDGREGLELIRRVRPNVVFSDVAMPLVGGFELAAEMKADPALASIPIVFMTASVQRSEIDQALSHGGAGVLAKPFTMTELRARVEEFAGAG